MNSFTLKAFAKVNLSLQVVGKRPDNFHDINTLFERISLYDELTFELQPQKFIRISCDHPQVPCGRKNLVYQVAAQLQKDFDIPNGAHVHIKKNIPVAAGLAGGSTNAATALLGLNRLWQLNLSQKQLQAYAASIGSDVPFFLYDVSWALGTGRGEEIQVQDLPLKLWHVLVVPKYKIYARDVYNSLRLKKLTKQNDNVSILLPYLKREDVRTVGSQIFNDLEPAILTIKPSLEALKKALQNENQVVGTIFSGSGPAIFALTESRESAEKLKERFSRQYKQVFVVHTA